MTKSSKFKTTRYKFSGMEEDFRRALRQFSLKSILIAVHDESVKLLQCNGDGVITNNVREIPLTYMNMHSSRFTQNMRVVSAPWVLLDLSYYAIKYTNDYCGKELSSEYDLAALILETNRFKEEKEHRYLTSFLKERNQLITYLLGAGGEQFKAQSPGISYDTMAREAYILFECIPDDVSKVDFKKVIEDAVGFPWDRALNYLILASMFSMAHASLKLIESGIDWREPCSWEEFYGFLSRYTTTYDEVRVSNQCRQLLSIKPFVRIDNDIICSNTYYCHNLLEHALLWIARNACMNHKPTIPALFGHYYEKYIETVLKDCIEGQYEKIEEKDNLRADWILRISKWTFLIEQKSSLVDLEVRQQSPSVENIEKYSKKNLYEALKQLHNTETALALQGCIKIVLLYEDYFDDTLLQNFLHYPDCPVQNDGLYWLMTTSELEMMMLLAKTDINHFDSIVEQKIQVEQGDAQYSGRINQLLARNGIRKNEYLEKPEICKYKFSAEKIISLIYDRG